MVQPVTVRLPLLVTAPPVQSLVALPRLRVTFSMVEVTPLLTVMS